jgi:hypothetical protein
VFGATSNITVSDFNPAEDGIVIQLATGEEGITVSEQAVVAGNLVITLSNGAAVTLSNVDAAINVDTLVSFVEV